MTYSNSKDMEHGADTEDINPVKEFHNKSKREAEEFHGFLSRQFPQTANPAPLGLGGFALTTFVLSMFNAGAIVDINSSHGVVMGLAMFYGGLVQLLAGMWEFKTGNTFGALAFSSYGGFWMSFAALSVKAFGFTSGYAAGSTDLKNCLGIYLFSWCIFSGLMTICAHRTTVLLFVLLFMVWLTFLQLSIGEFMGGDERLKRGGGITGIIAAALAWYGMVAGLLTKSNSLFRLPVGEFDPIYRSWGWILPDDHKE